MNDVLERIRKAETRPLDADGMVELWEVLQDALAEIKRLRLTDEEQSLIRRLAEECEDSHPRAWTNRALTADDRATLRGLLARCAIAGT